MQKNDISKAFSVHVSAAGGKISAAERLSALERPRGL